MAELSSKKSIEDLEKQLLKKNKDLNEKYLELETILDLTNTINSLDDLNDLFFINPFHYFGFFSTGSIIFLGILKELELRSSTL